MPNLLGHGAPLGGAWRLQTVAGGIFALATGWLLWRQSAAAAWVVMAWMLGVLLLIRPRLLHTVLFVLSGALVLGASLSWIAGYDGAVSSTLAAAIALEAGVAFLLLRSLGCEPAGLPDLKQIGCLGGAATIAAPALVGLPAGLVGALDPQGSHLWLDGWYISIFGAITLLPLMLGATPARLHALGTLRPRIELAMLALLTLATAAVASLWLPRPLIVLSVPLLVAAFRVGVLGTAILNLLAAVSVLALDRWSPAAQLSRVHMELGELAFYSALSLLPPLLVSVVHEQWQLTLAALRGTAEQLRLITDNVPALIGKLDDAGRHRFVNPPYQNALGRSEAELLGEQPEVLLRGASNTASAALERALSGERVRFDSQLPSGRELDVTFAPHLHDSEVGGVLILAKDVTERRAAERALFEAKEKAQVMLDSIGDAVIACDTELRITLLNPIAEDMTGWSEDQALGRTFDEVVRLVEPDTEQRPRSPMEIAIRENRIVGLQFDSALERRDGQRALIEDSAAPIHDREGRVIGGIMVFHDVSDSRAMALKMSHQAQHDYLTDLPNRVLLQDRLEQALAAMDRGGHGALLFVDLDHFKVINDSLGHQIGDLVLQEVAKRLSAAVRVGDTVSRQGGDEFVVLLPKLRDPRDAARVAEGLIGAMQPPIEADGHRLHIGLSVGIALFPQDATDGRELMKQADIALYHAKQAGRYRYSYFTASMSETAELRMRLEHDLRQALHRQELFLVYQPKTSWPFPQVTGMESLVRWRHGERIVSPAEFIPIAEETGLIAQIDAWAMREACRQNAAWQAAGAPCLPISVNVSLARLDADRLLHTVAETLHDTGLPAGCLEVEFTESQMFADTAHASQLIEGLRGLQVRIAMDDFGTGYSNLGYLAQYRFDTIKIDRSFICSLPEDGKQDAIVRAIVAMAGALEARVVAEGVETELQARALERHGCREIQGYLYSRPLAADAMFALLCGTGGGRA